MKKLKLTANALVALGFVFALAAIAFLPDKVPAHFNAVGEADRYGSRFEVLLLAGFVLLARLMMAGLTKLALSIQRDEEELTRKIMAVTTVLVVAFFDVLELYFIYAAAAKVQNLGDMPVGIWPLSLGAAAVILVVLVYALKGQGKTK